MSDIVRLLGIARRALHSQQAVMNTTANNIANVNTEGYSRQRAILRENRSHQTMAGYLGSGVSVQTIERVRDNLIDSQLISERPSFAQFEFKGKALELVEDIFNEPSEYGLNQSLADFFNSFQDLSSEPESSAAKTVVRQKASVLANNFNRIHGKLSEYQQQLNIELTGAVAEVNDLTSKIANLNKKIVSAEVGGHMDSEIRDQRDLLIDQLTELVDVRVSKNQNGTLSLSVAGMELVADSLSQKLSLKTESANESGPKLVMENGNGEIKLTNGKIKAILDIRDINIENYKNQLDDFAVNFTQAVNDAHSAGYNLNNVTGTNLFEASATGAIDFAVSSEVMNDANLIATSDSMNEPGNNAAALSIIALQDSLTMDNGQQTFSSFYNSLIATLGSQTQEANFLGESYGMTVEKLEFSRQAVSGVSLDEEMTMMIEAQQAYAAAAKVITNVDEMAQTILNMV